MTEADGAATETPGSQMAGFSTDPVDSVAIRRGPASQMELLRSFLDDAGIPAVVELETGRFLDPTALAAAGSDASLHVPREQNDEALRVLEEAHEGPSAGSISSEAEHPSGRFPRLTGSAALPTEGDGSAADGAAEEGWEWVETLNLERSGRRVHFLGALSIAFPYLFIAPFALVGCVFLQKRIRDAETRGCAVSSATHAHARAGFMMALIGVALLPILVWIALKFGWFAAVFGF